MPMPHRLKLSPRHITVLKTLIHVVSLLFVAQLVLLTLTGGFGADPVQGISHFTGKAALNTLLLTLCVSPVTRWLKQGLLVRVRRLLGLYSFSWAVLHLTAYLVLDLGLDWSLLLSEITERPYLTVGAACWLILCALAATSPQRMQRRLGTRWQKLHNWVYLAVVLAPVHYYWSVKSGVVEPLLYLLFAFVLLACRYRTFKRWLPAGATS
ncbi:protein-methionine-sulfoxide reductase heme-binding subunit MsrQ [Photobacterium ganghwense]|uniref:protein-methionine-sulfoxide reductase heme-binding subunit MsrQ n=1 Tax=Photobacterium ganghwense TaxID=320778 RepID=UPI00266EF62F|nr:protein-methionine-sulfoxide reductase heme-binding subunit MsrQ [Photobacterium ganghwense]